MLHCKFESSEATYQTQTRLVHAKNEEDMFTILDQ